MVYAPLQETINTRSVLPSPQTLSIKVRRKLPTSISRRTCAFTIRTRLLPRVTNLLTVGRHEVLRTLIIRSWSMRIVQTLTIPKLDCQRADWKAHKEFCKPLSKRVWLRTRFSSSPQPQPDSGVITTLVMNKNAMPDELRNQTPLTSADGPPPNIHGTTPFMVKIQVPVISTNLYIDLGMLVYDRQRSFTGYIMQSTDPDAYAHIEATVLMRGIMGMKMYRWAKMVADWTLEICLDVEPKEIMQW